MGDTVSTVKPLPTRYLFMVAAVFDQARDWRSRPNLGFRRCLVAAALRRRDTEVFANLLGEVVVDLSMSWNA
jgi:hypothetical protein